MKITNKQYKEIAGLKKEYPLRKILKHEIIFYTDPVPTGCLLKESYPLWLYILMFIPANIIVAFCYAWSEGLKYFEFVPRTIIYQSFYLDTEVYKRAKKILFDN